MGRLTGFFIMVGLFAAILVLIFLAWGIYEAKNKDKWRAKKIAELRRKGPLSTEVRSAPDRASTPAAIAPSPTWPGPPAKAPTAPAIASPRAFEAPESAPQPWRPKRDHEGKTRWEIDYIDQQGDVTHRIIQPTGVDLRRKLITAFCEQRRDSRHFLAKNIQKANDPVSGAPIDVAGWIEDVRMARRRERGRPT